MTTVAGGRDEMDDMISRKAAIDGILEFMPQEPKNDASSAEHVNYSAWCCALNCAESFVRTMPSVQPDLSAAYMKAVFAWLLDYQIKAAELKGRYTPYEVMSWVVNDWRKEHE